MELIAIYLISVIATTVIAARKGNPILGFIIGLFLGPLGVIVALLSGNKNRIPCPQCAEKIMKAAKVCPHCNSQLKPAA